MNSNPYDFYTLFGGNISQSNEQLSMLSHHINKAISNQNGLCESSSLCSKATSSSSSGGGGGSNSKKKLFVGNLPLNTTIDELLEIFGKYGRVNEKLSVVKDDNYAFIHFFCEADAEQAQRELNDSFFKSRYIRVQYSVSDGHAKKQRSENFFSIDQIIFFKFINWSNKINKIIKN